QLRTPPFHLRPREGLVPVVHGFELAAIDGDAPRVRNLASILRRARSGVIGSCPIPTVTPETCDRFASVVREPRGLSFSSLTSRAIFKQTRNSTELVNSLTSGLASS